MRLARFFILTTFVLAIYLIFGTYVAYLKFRGWPPPYPEVLLIPSCILFLLGFLELFIYKRVKTKVSRRELGLCVRCGYDLRATPDRCPECGKIVKQAI
jgi:hypothetical protein